MHNKDGLRADHQDSDLSFLDSGEKLHVDELSLVTDDVFVTEVHELAKLSVLDVVISGLSALDLGIKREDISGAVGSLILDNYPPDAFSSGPSVLLQNSLAGGKNLGESGLEIGDSVVDIGVFRDEA